MRTSMILHSFARDPVCCLRNRPPPMNFCSQPKATAAPGKARKHRFLNVH